MQNAHLRSMTEPERAAYLKLRGLENYNTAFINAKYPVLSFLFALYSGGEHTLYCDFSEDYVYAYLLQSVPGMTRQLFESGGPEFTKKLPKYMHGVFEVLQDLYVRSKARTVSVVPTPAELDIILAAIKVELEGPNKPMPVW